jgi:hypothetical protein
MLVRKNTYIPSAFRPHDFFSTCCYVTALFEKEWNSFPIYLRTLPTKQNWYHIYIRIQTLYSELCWSTFASDYSLKSSSLWCYKLGTAWGVSNILLCRSSLALPGRMGIVTSQLFSGLFRDVRSGSSPGSGLATKGHSETCPKATPALSWLCA